MNYPYRSELARIQGAQRRAEEYVNTHYTAEEIEKWGWTNLVSDLQMEFLQGMLPSQELAEQLKQQATEGPSERSEILEFLANPNAESEVNGSDDE